MKNKYKTAFFTKLIIWFLWHFFLVGQYGGQKVLNELEETNLCEGLLLCTTWGFPITKKDLRLLIKSYLDKIGRSEK